MRILVWDSQSSRLLERMLQMWQGQRALKGFVKVQIGNRTPNPLRPLGKVRRGRHQEVRVVHREAAAPLVTEELGVRAQLDVAPSHAQKVQALVVRVLLTALEEDELKGRGHGFAPEAPAQERVSLEDLELTLKHEANLRHGREKRGAGSPAKRKIDAITHVFST
eukprot:scaffold57_cov254-Pinguiococcus_pyrenoidosus.AAC.8